MAIAIPKLVLTPDMDYVVRQLRRRAKTGINRGRGMDFPYQVYCTMEHRATGTKLIYTRDAGHHTSGWLKNPQYERCLHLSLTFWEYPEMVRPRPFEPQLARLWVEAFFGEHCAKLWEEGPFSAIGRINNCRHWRLFCDEHWVPRMPVGEVYSTELTEIGWKSWSELHPEPLPTRAMRQAQ